jgi:MoaA/NifB/PqqE/SkfB family radical SAM enzyme
LSGLIKLLEFFDKERPNVMLSIELRTNMTLKDNINSHDFKKYIEKYYIKKIFSLNTINKFDDWAGQIRKEDFPDGMDMASDPIMQVRPCHRLYTISILYDGIVRLCNCRYQYGDITKDGLYLGNLNENELHHILKNKIISEIRDNFHKKIPNVCSKCKFYIPTKII